MKKFVSVILALLTVAAALFAAIPASAAKTGFSDVEDDRWSSSFIAETVGKGYMQGVGDGRFDPDGALTRAMAVTVLWRRQGCPVPSNTSGFTDVDGGAWYSDAVAWAKEAGIVFGVSDTLFDPDGKVTREALAAMLCRYAEYAPVSVPDRADLSVFTDGEDASAWAADPLAWAVRSGLLEGTDEGELDPKGYATREQFAAITERYDGTFVLEYNRPKTISRYTEKEYPLVTDADIYVSPTAATPP